MSVQLFRKPVAGLTKYVTGSATRPVEFYIGESIELPHNERILFDGYILNHEGKEEAFFKHLFENYGISDLVSEASTWDGAWSIVYINSNGTVYCFTDPLGKKQLYYNKQGDICSNIPPLVANIRADELYKSEVYKWGYNSDNRTPWSSVRRVLPNHVYMFMGSVIQNVTTEPYFLWDEDMFGPEALYSSDTLRTLVHSSVKRSLKSLPAGTNSVGVLLSGGLDSSVIAYELLLLKREEGLLKNVDLNFYTINNQEDAPYVKMFADRFGIQVKELNYDMDSVDLLYHLKVNETPVDLGSMVPNQIMFKSIPETVVFTGDGADELFGGYRRIDEYDSQKSDVFQELTFYHLPRLEKAAHNAGIDLYCPFLGHDVIRYALAQPFIRRKHKACLREAYASVLPLEILGRPKLPLKNAELRKDPIAYRKKLIEKFYSEIF